MTDQTRVQTAVSTWIQPIVLRLTLATKQIVKKQQKEHEKTRSARATNTYHRWTSSQTAKVKRSSPHRVWTSIPKRPPFKKENTSRTLPTTITDGLISQ